MDRSFCGAAVAALMVAGFAAGNASAQPTAVDNELARVRGHWRVVEMIENGNAIPETQMREWLPGGGVFEIVDYTVIFKSPLDGTKSTKSFRIDATSFPKQIAIFDRDTTTGTGIYEFNQGKLVLCITNEAADIPTEFKAPPGSGRTLMILEQFDPGTSEIPGLNVRLPPRQPFYETPPPAQVVNRPQPPANVAPPRVEPAPNPVPNPPIVAAGVAGRVLTDAEVRSMAIGKWRINDSEGSIDILFNPDGVFQTFRYAQVIQNFHSVFVPTPTASGNWSVNNGRLIANVTASTRFDKINHSYMPAVRSISATDMILEDHMGRVSRAVKVP